MFVFYKSFQLDAYALESQKRITIPFRGAACLIDLCAINSELSEL